MLAQLLRPIFRFRKTSVSILFVLNVVFVASLYYWDNTRYTRSVPNENDEYADVLESTWAHLQVISERPHAFTSPQNDVVHDYLKKEIETLVGNTSFIETWDDREHDTKALFKQQNVFNASSTTSRVVYYESSNLLVKIKGINESLPGLLVSAHFDSVPTGFGATDDGMGIVTLLGLLKLCTQQQPDRTMVFNFNNNEEFGLMGATLFMQHEWSKLVQFVLNLEGAGAGGKAVLFRTSDVGTASAYRRAVEDQPFGNSIYQQGFYDRYISSETDYKVYEENGLRGWDIAFYKPRSIYHTARDSIQYTSKASLWHMLHTSIQLCQFLTFEDVSDLDEETSIPAVYFDIIGLKFISFSAKSLCLFNCAILLLFPVVILALQIVIKKNKPKNIPSLAAWIRLPLSACLSYVVITFTRSFMYHRNALIYNRDFVSPTLMFASEFLLVNYFVLSLLQVWRPEQRLKTSVFLEASGLLWVLLLTVTWKLYASKYTSTGVYLATLMYLLISLGTVLDQCLLIFKSETSTRYPKNDIASDEEQDTSSEIVSTSSSEPLPENVEQEENERSPLIRNSNDQRQIPSSRSNTSGSLKIVTGAASKLGHYEWSVQFILVVPILTLCTFLVTSQVLGAINQTCQEGFKSAWNISMVSMLGGLFLVVPVLPFVDKINALLSTVLIGVFAITFALSSLRAPFTEESPLKLRFSQEVDVGSTSQDAMVYLWGRQGTLLESTLNDIPTIKNDPAKGYHCERQGDGQEKCSYLGLDPYPIDAPSDWKYSDIMNVNITESNHNSLERSPYEPIYAELEITSLGSRTCFLNFNFSNSDEDSQNSPLKQVTIRHDRRKKSSSTLLPGRQGLGTASDDFRWGSGIDELQLLKLDFQQPYRIRLEWMPRVDDKTDDPEMNSLGMNIKCYWGEYDSDSKIGSKLRRKVPAFDELLIYSPREVTYANREPGVVVMKDYIKL